MKNIYAKVSRGKNAGTILKPHKYQAGHYLVSKHGNTLDCSVKVFTQGELTTWVEKGYSIRMSGEGIAPSLYNSKNIIFSN